MVVGRVSIQSGINSRVSMDLEKMEQGRNASMLSRTVKDVRSSGWRLEALRS